MSNQEGLCEAHAAYLRRVVPPDQLFYFDVKSGWKPLCDILDVPPPDTPFPHVFPRSWLEKGKVDLLTRLKMRLVILVGGVGLLLGGAGFAGRKYLIPRPE